MKGYCLYWFCILCFTGLTRTLNGQSLPIEISGIALDSIGQPMIGATVILKQAEDGLMEGFSLTDDAGYFEIQSNKVGPFILQITYVGYGTFEKNLSLTESTADLNLGTITLNPLAITLEEALVKDAFIPIIIKNDTIQYHAKAFKTGPNATVEDLLKKLPGVEVEQDGTIKAQGETVKEILVDGKPFFEEDPKIASRNIPADVVDEVQVFDKASDLAYFTGIDDGNEAKTINLNIAEGKNKGWFGNGEAAYGEAGHYKLKGMLNRFNDRMQASIIANANDINEQVFTLEDYLKFSGGLEELMQSGNLDLNEIPSGILNQDGVNTSQNAGLNLNYDFNTQTTLRFNYFYNDRNSFTEQLVSSRNVLNNNSFQTSTNNIGQADFSNHQAKLNFKHQFDDSQQILFISRLGSNLNRGITNRTQQSQTKAELINTSIQSNAQTSDFLDWSFKFDYQKRFKKAGRFTTLMAAYNTLQTNSQLDLQSTIQTFTPPGAFLDTLTQQQRTSFEQPGLELKWTYSEPLKTGHYLQFTAGYEHSESQRDKQFFDFIEETNSSLVRNEKLSNFFDRNYEKRVGGLAYAKLKKDSKWTSGINLEQIALKSVSNDFSRTFNFLLPYSFFNHIISNGKQLRLRYQTQINLPAIEQMQAVVDNSNPLFMITGNPDLVPEYQHQISGSYISFNQFYLRTLHLNLLGRWIRDPIINTNFVDERLRSSIRPINEKNAIYIQSYLNYEAPIKWAKLKYEFTAEIRHQDYPISINDILDRYRFSQMSYGIQFQNSHKKVLDFQIGYTLDWNQLTYQANTGFDQRFLNHTLWGNINLFLNKEFHFKAALEQLWYSKDQLITTVPNFFFLDLTLTKGFNDGKWSCYVSAQNILGEDERFRRSAFGNQYQNRSTNRIGRIFMLGFVYKLRKFG